MLFSNKGRAAVASRLLIDCQPNKKLARQPRKIYPKGARADRPATPFIPLLRVLQQGGVGYLTLTNHCPRLSRRAEGAFFVR